MSYFEEDLVTMASNHAGLSALIGTQIFPDKLPPEVVITAARGAVVYTLLAGAGAATTFTTDSGVVVSTIQFDCYSTTRLGAIAIHNQVRDCYVGKSYGKIEKGLQMVLSLSVLEDDVNLWRGILDIRMKHKVGA